MINDIKKDVLKTNETHSGNQLEFNSWCGKNFEFHFQENFEFLKSRESNSEDRIHSRKLTAGYPKYFNNGNFWYLR